MAVAVRRVIGESSAKDAEHVELLTGVAFEILLVGIAKRSGRCLWWVAVTGCVFPWAVSAVEFESVGGCEGVMFRGRMGECLVEAFEECGGTEGACEGEDAVGCVRKLGDEGLEIGSYVYAED